MIFLVERVRAAAVRCGSETLGAIGPGLLVQVGFVREDTDVLVGEGACRLLTLRVFPDRSGRLASACAESAAEILLVPAFVLTAEAAASGRLDFGAAAPAGRARELFERLRERLEHLHTGRVASGRFGAAMQIAAEHDGPVPFVCRLTATTTAGVE